MGSLLICNFFFYFFFFKNCSIRFAICKKKSIILNNNSKTSTHLSRYQVYSLATGVVPPVSVSISISNIASTFAK